MKPQKYSNVVKRAISKRQKQVLYERFICSFLPPFYHCELDSGLLYIIGNEYYWWHDEDFNIATDSNEGHLNQIICDTVKQWNKNVLEMMSYAAEDVKKARKDINHYLNDEWFKSQSENDNNFHYN